MITKEIWSGLTQAQKNVRVTEALTSLCEIEQGKHALQGTPEQGKISVIKKDLEHLVLNFIEWETPNYEENRPSA